MKRVFLGLQDNKIGIMEKDMKAETCNVVDYVTNESYHNQDDAQYMANTLAFGEKLQHNGWHIKYATGPVGIYKGLTFLCENMRYTNLFEDWFFHMNKEKYLFLLYQVTPERVRFARLKLEEIRDVENA